MQFAPCFDQMDIDLSFSKSGCGGSQFTFETCCIWSSPRLCPRAITFLIYINDVTNIELSPGTLLSLYADDMLQINSLNDYTDLQTDINKISSWADAI